jgi:two-component system cell cycle response regulator
MHSVDRVLVIGPCEVGECVSRALAPRTVVVAERALEGVWESGRNDYDGVLVSLSLGDRALRALNSVRSIAPRARLVVSCHPVDEPDARRTLAQGAADYAIEPLGPRDVERIFGIERAAPAAPAVAVTPTPDDLARFSDIVRDLHHGARFMMDRLAEMVAEAFQATGALVQLDDLVARAGDSQELVIEEAIVRGDRQVGRVALARRRSGTYAAGAALWLATYAVLIQTAVDGARKQQHWQELAWTDDLTGLRNRRYFDQRLAELLDQAGPRHERLTILLFDIDDFKSYNDRFGHETGDALLREVAMLLTRCTRATDVVARYGGDEFAVIFWDAEQPRVPGSHHPSEPIALAARFCAAMREHQFHCLGPGAPGPLTISGGLAAYPWDGARANVLLRAADQALLAAKRVGKSQICLSAGIQDVGT